MASAMATLLPLQFFRHSATPSTTSSFSKNSAFSHGNRRFAMNNRAPKPVANEARRLKTQATHQQHLPEALLFDCDGVLVDTERDGHRVCFNKAFEEQGLQVYWDEDYFGTILDAGVGKNRIRHYFDTLGWPASVPESQREDFLSGLHKRKTDLFIELVESGELPLRPGVAALIDEAVTKGVQVAVCSTSLERAVSAVVRVMLGAERAEAMKIFAGDVVAKKKPNPAVYRLAAESLNVRAERCVVIEDSHVGLTAAKGAGMVCIVTTSAYTEGEDFSLADAVFPCIGEPPNQNFDLSFAGSLLLDTKRA